MISRLRALLAPLLALALLVGSLAPAAAQFTDQRNYGAVSAGTSAAYTITIPNYGSTPIPGIHIVWVPHTPNPSAATLTIAGGSGAIALCKPSAAGPTPLTGGELQINQPVSIIYNTTAACQVIESSVDSTAASIFTPPQGYLTPCQISAGSPVSGCTAGFAVPTGDVTAATVLYYEPVAGNQIPIWNGSKFVVFQFTEAQLTLTLGSTNLANTIYDICVFSNSGTPTIVTSVAWTASGAGSGNRGSGAGTAQIVNKNGIWTNAVVTTGKNGATTYSNIPANQCTMVATMLVDGTNGQVSFTRTWGQNRRWALSNFYNGEPLAMRFGDPTGSWTYGSSTIRQARGDAGNVAIVVQALPSSSIESVYLQAVNASGSGSGVGVNSTTTFCGPAGNGGNSNPALTVCTSPPIIGRTDITANEQSTVATSTFIGTEVSMAVLVRWKG